MISPPVIIQAAQTFARCSLLTIHERQGIGALTHGSGVFSLIPLIQRDCKILMRFFAEILLDIFEMMSKFMVIALSYS
jgi:hypothetical protein